ncbi:MAG: cytochrome P450 [Myxococcota bacterium]
MRFAARLLRAGPPDAFRWLHRTHGPTVRVRLPGRTILSITDPGDVHEVTRARFRSFGKGDIDAALVPLWGTDNLLSAHGDVWRGQRRAAQPAFQPERAPALQAIAVRQARAAFDPVAAQAAAGPVRRRLYHDLRPVVMAALCEDWLGVTDPAEAARLSALLTRTTDIVTRRVARPVQLPPWLPTPGTLRLRRRLRAVDDAVTQLLARGPRGEDLLSLLLAADLPEGQRRGDLVVFLVAAYETPSLGWALDLLARHPALAERAAAEVAEVLDGRDPAVDDLPRLRYLQACVREALRLNPPSPVLFREALEDTPLATCAVARGTTVAVAACALHRDPAFWGDPDAVRPERFLEQRVPSLQFLPFGAGPRACIGGPAAMQLKTTLLAMLLQRFRLAAEPGPPPRPRDPLRPHPDGGVPAILTLRERAWSAHVER